MSNILGICKSKSPESGSPAQAVEMISQILTFQFYYLLAVLIFKKYIKKNEPAFLLFYLINQDRN